MTATSPTIQIRRAVPADGPQLARLAALDSAPVPFGDVLLAELDGRPVAALDLGTGAVVADPFTRTAHLVALLRTHARSLEQGSHERRARRHLGYARLLRPAA